LVPIPFLYYLTEDENHEVGAFAKALETLRADHGALAAKLAQVESQSSEYRSLLDSVTQELSECKSKLEITEREAETLREISDKWRALSDCVIRRKRHKDGLDLEDIELESLTKPSS
jgi:septation ring formation regulator EzrA